MVGLERRVRCVRFIAKVPWEYGRWTLRVFKNSF